MNLSMHEHTLVRAVQDCGSDSFVELARVAELDPATDFIDADLRGIDFGTDDLSGFNFTGADLRGANLSSAQGMILAIFDKVIIDETTRGLRRSNVGGAEGEQLIEATAAGTMATESKLNPESDLMFMYPLEILKVSQTLGGIHILNTELTSMADLLSCVEHGLPRAVVTEIVAKAVPSDRPDLRQKVASLIDPLGTDTSDANQTLSAVSSERAERLARITALAHQALGDAEEAKEWLTEPHDLLSRRMPIEVAVTDLGARLVERILLNIEHGLPV